jgi:RNA polymerase sigma-70 factor, ECF subfamily
MFPCHDSISAEKVDCAEAQKISEERLLADAKGGKPEAFEALCEGLTPRLLKIALRITQNREDADDAVQDSLMRAYMHIKNFQENCRFSTWVTRIVMNSALMIRRKNHSMRRFSPDDLGGKAKFALPFEIADHSPNPEQGVYKPSAYEFSAGPSATFALVCAQ